MNVIRWISFFLIAMCNPAVAEETVQVAAAPTMAAAIEPTQFITEIKPNPKAQYYMFFYTASWCSPCRAVMPKIIAEYPRMKANDYMEIIVISFDDDVSAAQSYLSKSGAPFAALMNNSAEPSKLPGCVTDVCSIPHIVIVDAHGNFVYRGHALRYKEWKSRTARDEKH